MLMCKHSLHSNSPGLWSDEHVAGWKKVNDAVHAHGSAMFAQLWHMGRVAHPDMPEQKAAGIVREQHTHLI
jgi:2,4-dienoyl-CoA reductase-like NADH-dependent reductase (Old Yellow Enzyme family)